MGLILSACGVETTQTEWPVASATASPTSTDSPTTPAALATHDQEFADFVGKGYAYARSVGWPLVGFFPEYIEDWPDDRPYIDCETCATVDMIMMAINLSKLGQGDYWDDVDRYVRNQFTEMQMKRGVDHAGCRELSGHAGWPR